MTVIMMNVMMMAMKMIMTKMIMTTMIKMVMMMVMMIITMTIKLVMTIVTTAMIDTKDDEFTKDEADDKHPIAKTDEATAYHHNLTLWPFKDNPIPCSIVVRKLSRNIGIRSGETSIIIRRIGPCRCAACSQRRSVSILHVTHKQ